MPDFTGFGADTIGFLAELEANNNRDWFKENKHRYGECVLEPALDFIAACNFPVANAASARFVDEAAGTFARARPLMAFLCAAVEVPF